jgi:RNA polymerase sigma factor (sigma-70 family)
MVSSEDDDLELLFSEARRYPLLSADQEKEIDAEKWAAVADIQLCIGSDKAFFGLLQKVLSACLNQPPDVASFENRDHHFVLRRELSAFFADGNLVNAAQDVSSIRARATQGERRDKIASLELPASLSVGLATLALRAEGKAVSDTVADAIAAWLPDLCTTPLKPLSNATRKALMRALRRYNSARDALVLHNIRLVYSIAAKYRGRGVPLGDLVQEGTLGLIRGAEKFEYAKGFRFSTYCFNWIQQAIRRYVGDAGAMIRIPTHVHDQLGKLYRERQLHQQATGELIGPQQLARKLEIEVDKVTHLMQIKTLHTSLDTPTFDEDLPLIEQIDGDSRSDQNAEETSLARFMKGAVEALDRAEREVILARWGLNTGPALSRAEIADKMGVSREWVRQLERSALKKLRDNPDIQDTFADYALN